MSRFELPPQIPSSAFGDGSHPTTRLCARAVDFFCRQDGVSSVLDVGTGTGVLARIARARGANFVVGTDIDPLSLEAAQANLALDHLISGYDRCEILLCGSMPDAWGPRFDLVVANILEHVLVELAPMIVRSLRPGGRCLLSGFTRVQVPALQVAYGKHGLTRASASYLDEWALLELSAS